MGVRNVLADDILQDKLTALAKAGRFQIGLLIGQVSHIFCSVFLVLYCILFVIFLFIVF